MRVGSFVLVNQVLGRFSSSKAMSLRLLRKEFVASLFVIERREHDIDVDYFYTFTHDSRHCSFLINVICNFRLPTSRITSSRPSYRSS
jgi:hypothetical protein